MVIRLLKKAFGSTVADWLVRIGLAVMMLVGSYSAWVLQDYVRCQAAYNQADQQRAEALAGPAARERDGIRNYVVYASEALADGNVTPEEESKGQFLFNEMAAAYVAGDKARAANPVPPPPDELCG